MINHRCEWAGKFVAGAIRGVFGAFKVGEVELNLPNKADRKMWSVDITPEMKESVMEGQVMFSVITPEQDQEYMDAVNSGDMEKAGEMVKAAFKAAYPNTKVVDENGEPLVVYHGSPRWFTEFKPQTSHANNINTPEGAYFFSKLRDNAQSYTSKKGSVELNPKKIGTRKVLNNNGEYEEIKDIKGGIYSVFLNITNPLIVDYKGNNWSATEMIYEATDWSEEEDAQFKTEEEREKWMNERKSEGHDVSSRRYEQPVDGLKETNIYIDSAISSGRYDGAIFTNIDDYGSYPHSNHEITDEFIAFQPNQIKSAEPVTYDDEGNVIPLSERFSESDDIRYSVILGDKKDNNGNRFFEKDGTIDLWRLDDLFRKAGREIAPIRLTDKNVNHTLKNHNDFFKNIGDVIEYTDYVLQNANVMRKTTNTSVYVSVEVENDPDKTAILRLYLSDYGDYYNVETVGNRRKGFLNNEKFEIIARRSEPFKNEAASFSARPTPQQSNNGNEESNATDAIISFGKGTTNSPTDQINSQENSQNSNIVDNQGDIEEDIRYSTTDSQESSDALQSAIEIEDDEMPEYRDADHLGESMMQYFERYSKWRDKMMADNMNPDGTPKLNIPVAPICFGYPISQQNQ